MQLALVKMIFFPRDLVTWDMVKNSLPISYGVNRGTSAWFQGNLVFTQYPSLFTKGDYWNLAIEPSFWSVLFIKFTKLLKK